MTSFEIWEKSEERRRAKAVTKLGAQVFTCLCLKQVSGDDAIQIGPKGGANMPKWKGPACCSLRCAKEALEAYPEARWPWRHATLFVWVWSWGWDGREQMALASWRWTRKRKWMLTHEGRLRWEVEVREHS